MTDNTARAKRELGSMRRAIRDHIDKYKKYKQQHEKDFAVKTISNVQAQIAKLKSRHPTLGRDSSWEDTWRP
jgi:hypothetical protein